MRTRERGWRRSLVFWAMAHLAIVGAIAAHLYPILPGRLLPLINFYYGFTGANSHYGFFAPNIGTEIRANFDVIDKRGRHSQWALAQGASHEATLRLNNMAALFSGVVGNQRLERSLTASWASRLFSERGDAVAVAVTVEALVLPSMAQFRQGMKPHWEAIYRARYTCESFRKEPHA